METALYHRIIALVSPFVATIDERKALLHLAFHNFAFLNIIDYDGTPQVFTVNLLRKLEAYGLAEDGVPLIGHLLKTLRNMVGIRQQSDIDALLEFVMDTDEIPTQPFKPVSVTSRFLAEHYRDLYVGGKWDTFALLVADELDWINQQDILIYRELLLLSGTILLLRGNISTLRDLLANTYTYSQNRPFNEQQKLQADIWLLEGNVFFVTGNLKTAHDRYTQAAQNYQALGDPCIVEVNRALGNVWARREEYTTATHHYTTALAHVIQRQEDIFDGYSLTLRSMFQLQAQRGYWQTAFENQLQLLPRFYSLYYRAETHIMLAVWAYKQSQQVTLTSERHHWLSQMEQHGQQGEQLLQELKLLRRPLHFAEDAEWLTIQRELFAPASIRSAH